MGVHGLWDLLAPVGRRVSVETLAGKKLAIDASIWMVQFMKAMRDEKGEMVRNAHLLGFFRRICKLLYLRTKPVFVFDGATPALKRRTVIARRRQRDNAQAKIRKTAEKLLLNHLKSMRLKELAKDLENQRKKQNVDDAKGKGKNVLSDQTHIEKSEMVKNDMESYDQQMLDEMLQACIAAKKDECSNNNASISAARGEEEEDNDENEQIILPEMDGNVDPAVLASLPPSMQLDLLMRERLTVENRKKNQDVNKEIVNQNEVYKSNAKEVLVDLAGVERSNLERDNVVAESHNQEKLDEMLAASIAAEEDENLIKAASTSAAAIFSEEEGNDEDEEMILPEMPGKVDPAVLAALPPSMQLDLLVQMRERLMAENRQKYQKVKKAPEKFSELQIEAYLKTVAFRREIDQVQKAAAGNGIGGVQSSRIASEANREFIFSSSFTGDKRLLSSNGVQRNGNKQQQTPTRNPSSDSVDCGASTSESNAVTGLVQDESGRVFDENVETYLDERGRIRVSRLRAMGMRMTRDLQRNLDLMKEIEQESTHTIKTASVQTEPNRDKIDSLKTISIKRPRVESSHDHNGDSIKLNEINQQSILNNEGSMQISFEVDGGSKCFDSDDDVFTSLVAGQSVKISSSDNVISEKLTSDAVFDSDWEEGIVEKRGDSSFNDLTLETNPPDKEGNDSDDSEVEWEDGAGDRTNSSFPSESGKPTSRGLMEEEADLQEAIRRSLEDLGGEKFNISSSRHEKLKICEENSDKDVRSLDQDDNTDGLIQPQNGAIKQDKSFSETLEIVRIDSAGQRDMSQVFSSRNQLKLSELRDPDNMHILRNKSNDRQPSQNAKTSGSLHRDMPSAESAAPLDAKEIHVIMEQSSDTIVEDIELSTSTRTPSAVGSSMPFAKSVDDEGNEKETEPSACHPVEVINHSTFFMEPSVDSTIGTDVELNLAGEKNSGNLFNEKEQDMDKFMSNENLQADLSDATLQEEILILGEESRNLGYEQKKLERNAESVSSEMFAECQELLQMFGLPYIIAPMEAEAQCAYMELLELVDGVVTDDSDVFLFGARNVYKNIFDDRKYVETYFMKDVEKELGLTREKLIRMALLLGSDYTEGISGIGIVNAIEVVNAFPEDDGLEKFREWIDSPDPTILGKFDMHNDTSARKNCSSTSANSNVGVDSFDQNISEAHEEKNNADHIEKTRQIFMDKHRNVSKNWHVPSSFPSETVISAYMCPQVDKSTEPFTWGKLDLHVLRRLCWEKFSWGVQKSDELLLPVLKEYNKHETQLRLEAFYSFNERFAKIRSKRIKKALKGITRYQSSELMDYDLKDFSEGRKKRTTRPSESKPETPLKRKRGGIYSDKTDSLEKSVPKRSRKKTAGKTVFTKAGNSGQQSHADGSLNTYKGCGGGRGRGCKAGRGKEGGIELSDSDSSYVYVSGGDDELEVGVEKSERPQEVRRSVRPRKPANYTEDDIETDVDRALLDQGDKDTNEEAVEPGVDRVVGTSGDGNISLCDREQHKVEDPLPDAFEDYLDGGEQFFTDDDGSGQAGVSQNSCPSEVIVSKDYLKIGGGFCMDESEICTHQDAAHGPSMPAVWEAADSSNLSGIKEEIERDKGLALSTSSVKRPSNDMHDGGKMNDFDTGPSMDSLNTTDSGDHSKVSLPVPESVESNTGILRLSGMPSLKRKRRKN